MLCRSFGGGDALTFRARGALGAGARGYVTSNFLLSASGPLTDHHLGLLFLERPA